SSSFAHHLRPCSGCNRGPLWRSCPCCERLARWRSDWHDCSSVLSDKLLGVFITYQPVGKDIIGNAARVFWLEHRNGYFLVVGSAKERRMRYFDIQNILTPNFPRIGNNSRGVGRRRTVHGKEYSQLLVRERVFRPHDTLHMVD